MQTQQTRRLQVFPVQIAALALGLFVALMLAGTFGFWLGGLRTSNTSQAPAPLAAVGRDQIGHDRSEQGLGVVPSPGGEQIAHDRSEGGLREQ
jgi:hypothetical protein